MAEQRVTDEQLTRRQLFVDQGLVPAWVGDLIADLRASRAREAELIAEQDDWAAMGRIEAWKRVGELRVERDGLQQRSDKALRLADRGILVHSRLIIAALTGTDTEESGHV